MEIGIGLPSTIPGVEGRQITGWARRAEERGFSTLGTIDRLVYPNYEPLVALSAAAAVTERIRLTTDILLAPLRANAALLAKQAATLDHLSGGRLVLGVAPGARRDDYEASGVPFSRRGRRFDEALERMRSVWDSEAGIGPVSNGGPRVLIGGSADVAFRRAARWDGWTMGGGAPDDFAAGLEKLRAAWREQGREGQPRALALCYYALGDDAQGKAGAYLNHYYAYLGEHAEAVAQSAATDPETCAEYARGFEAAGADELIFFPSSPELEQVDLLAGAVL